MNLKVDFTPLIVDDLEEIMALEVLCFPAPWAAETYRRDLSENPRSFYFALRPSADSLSDNLPPLLAYGGYWIMGNEAHIMSIATHPEWRRRQLGQRLLLNMLAQIRQVGVPETTLEVRASNQAAIQLYLKWGFIEVGRRRNYYRNPREDALLLTLFGLDDGKVWLPLRSELEKMH